MMKPQRLRVEDVIATISPAWGCAGDADVVWKYRLGAKRLEELGLRVVAAPNSLRGAKYLAANPQARVDDVTWAFENPEVKAILANIGGNDSVKLLPLLDPAIVREHPKIFCGYSDVLTLHLFCHRQGLTTFYGGNLLTNVAEAQGWHPYSRYWFQKALFDPAPLGEIAPSADWTHEEQNHADPGYVRKYVPNPGYRRVQGHGTVRGRLFGGHASLMEYDAGSGIAPTVADFDGAIFFFEDIPEFCDAAYLEGFLDWMGQNGFLQALRGIVFGKMQSPEDFAPYEELVRQVIGRRYGRPDLPVLSGLNFGHTSPVCMLPFGAEAELDADGLRFSILESGVI